MKKIKLFSSNKYTSKDYQEVEKGIYKKDKSYFLSISFEQEPKYEEGVDASNISQYPIEDIMDRFTVHVSDFYKELNLKGKKECYIEFSSNKLENLVALKTIIGKHVYNAVVTENGEQLVDLIIE